MKKSIFVLLVILFITALFIYCKRTQSVPIASELKIEQISEETGIPLEYGKLIAITSPQVGRAHLWFEDDNQTIRLVEIIYGQGKRGIIFKEIRKIERK
jgi:hypothetical protein